MPSSISSSDFETGYQTLDQQGRLKVAVKTLIAGILVFGAVVAIYNGILQSLGNFNGRMVAQLQHLPQLVAASRDKDAIMVFGSSMVQAGFEPEVFDRAMQGYGVDTISYNYGVGNLNPRYQALMTRRVREAFQAGDQKLSLALIEFNPFQTTKVRDTVLTFTADQNDALLASLTELWQLTLRDPTRGIRLFNIRFLRDGMSAELFTSLPGLLMSQSGSNSSKAEYGEARDRSEEIFDRFNEQRDSSGRIQGGDRWSASLRGGRIDKSTLSEQALKTLSEYVVSRRNPLFMEDDLQRRIDTSDILDLDFEEELILAFIEMVENFKPIADVVEVIVLPRNTDWVTYSPEVQRRLSALLRRIEWETEVVVRDFQTHPRITPEHYIDTTHLSFAEGIDVYTELLAETYAGVIGKPR